MSDIADFNRELHRVEGEQRRALSAAEARVVERVVIAKQLGVQLPIEVDAAVTELLALRRQQRQPAAPAATETKR